MLKIEAEISCARIYEICLLGKSLLTSMSFCCQLLLKNTSVGTAFHLFLFLVISFSLDVKQMATSGRFFCSYSSFDFPCTCAGFAIHDCMPVEQ